MHSTANDIELTIAQQSYLTQRLQQVSRSFALVVPFLELPLRDSLATAYLLCRVVDNIEDSGQADQWKIQRFSEFSRLLSEPFRAAEQLANWERQNWPALTENEQRMMGVAEGLELWQIFSEMPQGTQATIRLWVGIMAEGMKQLSDSASQRVSVIHRNGYKLLKEEPDYNEYCYFVAGTVGHLVTELVILQYDFSDEVAHPLRMRAKACGRALQKTNIIKDFVEDLERGICYLPDEWLEQADYVPLALRGAPPAWKEMVLQDVLGELHDATEYLLALPYSAAGYRRAALMCLLPAYQTIRSAGRNLETLFTPAHQIKISHQTMAQCLKDSEALLFDNPSIQAYSQRLQGEIQAQFDVPVAAPEQ